MRHSRDFKVGDLVIVIHHRIAGKGRIEAIGSVYIRVNGFPFQKDNVHRIKYNDQHTVMVYDAVSDTKEAMLVSSETIEYLEKMMAQ